MDYIRKSFSGPSEEESSTFQDATALTFGTRIRWFIGLFVAGFICSILGSIFLWLPRGLLLFGLFYTIGNLLSIGSTVFLMGPMKQIKKMFEQTRWIATLVMFIFMALTLMSALWFKKKALCLLFCIFQFMAMTWYSLSYIPYARNAIIGCCKNCIN